ncbi:unnamed protein product [Caenorhabditis nigoni]
MAKFGAAKMKQAPLSIEAKRARNRRNSQNFQNRRRREAAEIETRVTYLEDCHRSAENSTKFLEREFLRFFGPDALNELRHTVHPCEIDLKAFDELLGEIQAREEQLEEIAKKRPQPGVHPLTNASQKSRANAALKHTKMKYRKLELELEIKKKAVWQDKLKSELGVNPPRAEAYGSSAAIKTNPADDRSYSTHRCPNPSLECPLKAAQNTKNPDFMDMPVLEREEDPSKAKESEDAVRNYTSNNFHSNTPGGWQKKEINLNSTCLQRTHDRYFINFECSHGSETADESHDFFGETSYAPSKIKISAAIKTNPAHDQSSEDREWQNPGPLKAFQNTDFFATPISERQEDPSMAEESSSVAAAGYQKCPKLLLGRLHHESYNFSEKQENALDVDVIDGILTANTGISTNVNSETPKLRQRRQTLLAPLNKRQRTDVSGGTINLLDDRFIYNDPKITNSPSPLHRHEDPSQAEESEDALRNYISNNSHSTTHGGWQKEEMTLDGTVLQNTHDRFFDFECSHGTTATQSHDFFEETRYEPSKMKIRSTPSPLNTAQQQSVSPSPSTPLHRPLNNSPRVPVSPTEQLCKNLSSEGVWNKALEPSPASSFVSGELAEDYWEPDWPAPTNDAGLPMEDSMEPDWLEPSSNCHHTTAAMDRWTANGQEF